MGCDIHDYLEIRRDGRWCYAGDNAFPGNEYDFERHSPFDGARSYGLFGFLADVRNYSGVPPLSGPRGLPADVSDAVAGKLDSDWLHSHSWLVLAELLAFDYGQEFEDQRALGGPSCTTYRDFLGEWYFGRLDLMSAFGDPEDVRVVFAFDN